MLSEAKGTIPVRNYAPPGRISILSLTRIRARLGGCAELPTQRRAELMDMPDTLSRLHVSLAKYLEIHRAGVVLASPADISWGPDVLVQPDIFVAPVEQVRTLEQEAQVPLYWIVDGDARAGRGLDAGGRLPSNRGRSVDLAA